ncbi:acyl-CoA synthetase [Nocardioides psychrotolerans]|uniref:Acyl-CoA synthetase (AMP-forming)/AMP-acid ligase II n=1 Tax=Nocardioides psychrotolerans TaxID=1005945 RepID=A0A1I3G0G9_9ACTN|nr:FadD3 family acyl-CoA ligase [Nocardioides psychrotolerans]GEP37403.1 acyl-CoA synthetase [Nocardioides psychrotolerans]SFI16973.1 Acyl-CoA synthetase (AMP-forming)/AMP-acid ligase II [Nocardioides psychrotolerans]
MPTTLPRVLRAAADRFGDHPAYVEGDRVLSFINLLHDVRRVAAGYRSRGLERGGRVVLWAPNSIDWAVAALAVTYAGGTLVPVNSRYTGSEVADVVDRTGALLVVVADGFLGRTQVADLRAASDLATVVEVVEVTRLDAVATDPGDIDRAADAVSRDDVADILFTSGTTGRSKGAMSAHRQTIGVAQVWADLGGVRADDRYLVVNPFFHSFGYKIGIVVGLLTGATLYPVATFDLDATMTLIETERITLLPGAPTIYQSLLGAPGREERDLSSLRLAVTGAAVVPVVLIERMRAPAPEGLGIDQVVTAFGMTEAVVATMCREDDSAETVATTCGRAIPGMEVRIDSTTGEAGELLLRGEHVMLGYLDDPAATAETVDADGWLHTGDVGTVDEAGNLRITDRLKDMYISGGFNVYPAEVEQALARLGGVADVAVIGVPDERLGEVGKAYVVRSGTSSEGALTVEDVIAFARQRLANFKVPRHVTFVDALPRNLSGKVLKTALRED